jgi:hypothetical protein
MRAHIQTSETIDSQVEPSLPSTKEKLGKAKVYPAADLNMPDQITVDSSAQETHSDKHDSEKNVKKKVDKSTKKKTMGENSTTGEHFQITLF